MAGRRALVPFAVLLAAVLAGCGDADPAADVLRPPSTSAPPATTAAPTTVPATPAPSVPPSPSPTAPPADEGGTRVAVPVYYVAETAAGFRLQREFHSVVTNDPASAAVREMLAGPSGNDPDYRSHWPPAAELREPVRREGGAIVVDLTGVGPAQVGTELANLTVQQLVFTVQAALQSTDPVRILVDGRPAPELWGAVETTGAVDRGDPYALRSLVQIDSPAEGAEVGREVEVRGEAAVFEATVLWEVLRDGALVQKGAASTAAGMQFAPFEFTVTLEPGTYTVRIREDDPSGGEGRPVLTDDKTFTVTG